MRELEKKVLNELMGLRDPTTNAPILLLEARVEVAETTPGVIRITFTPTNPLSPTALAIAEAVKTKAQKVEGVKKVTIECKNHIMADTINRRLNKTTV